MLQYLLNATAIWLISLLSFDVFLRRESYHGYNRFYLLGTFLLGLFLPTVHWQDGSAIRYTAFARPLAPLVAAKQNAIATVPAALTSSGGHHWLAWIYMAGALAAVAMLLADVIKTATLYRAGKKSMQNGWIVIETGSAHTPFSFLNMLFVCSAAQYTQHEWRMILMHEGRHKAFFHLADLLLMEAARIVFWFHPLAHVYHKRLTLVHEYQADGPVSQPHEYGTFLVEQSLLASAPSFSIPFNRPSVKKRIIMLSRRSSPGARSKWLVLLPLLLVCTFCFTQNVFSQRPVKHGGVCHYKGNTIEFLSPKKPDSYMHRDEVTGKLSRAPINWPEPPILLNGKKIYDPNKDGNIAGPVFTHGYKSLGEYIYKNAENEFRSLDDGNYFFIISDVVIDAAGKVVYFKNEGIFKDGGNTDKQPEQKKHIDDRLEELMENAPDFAPATVNNTAVAYRLDNVTGYHNEYDFTVKNHVVIRHASYK